MQLQHPAICGVCQDICRAIRLVQMAFVQWPATASRRTPGRGGASQLRAVRLLSAREEGQRERTVAAELERAKILVPRPVERVRFGTLPVIQPGEIGGADRALLDPLEEVRQYGWG